MFRDKNRKRIFIDISAVVFWLAVWQAASTFTGLDFILAGPVKVLFCLAKLLCKSSTYTILAHSFMRISVGFLLASASAFAAGILAFRYRISDALMNPLVTVMKSLPVAAFIILALMIAGASWVSAVTAFIVTFPTVYYGTLEGMKNLDKNLNDMADVFKIKGIRRFRFIIIPQCLPYIRTAVRTSSGMCWKAGTAAEIIGLPALSIGEQMYLSKLYLESDALLSWGVMIILAGAVFEKIFLRIISGSSKAFSRCRDGSEGGIKRRKRICREDSRGTVQSGRFSGKGIYVSDIFKSFGEQRVLEGISLSVDPGERVCLMGESGIGKTTLIRIMLGLEQADTGSVASDGGFISAVFQESSLCPWMSAVENVCIAAEKGCCSNRFVRDVLTDIIGKDSADKPSEALSGGMKRRCETVRALLCDSSAVILDEPFAGLDKAAKDRTIRFILENIGDRPLIVCTHDADDVKALSATAFVIDKNDNDC